jgi:hypothetical protein
MNVDHQSSEEDRERRRAQYSTTAKVDLEALAVSAILEHRRLFESDQSVYEEWERSVSDPNTAPAVAQSLQDEYTRRRAKTAEQQELLSDLIDVLGYVPDVPVEEDG